MIPVGEFRRRRDGAKIKRGALGVLLLGLAALPAAALAPPDPLACFVAADGQAVRIGDPVVGPDGRELGWVSSSQCAADAPADRLRVMRSVYPYEVIEVERGAVTRDGARVALRPGADGALMAAGGGASPRS